MGVFGNGTLGLMFLSPASKRVIETFDGAFLRHAVDPRGEVSPNGRPIRLLKIYRVLLEKSLIYFTADSISSYEK